MRFIPAPPPEALKTCQRCNLQSPEKTSECTHCAGLSDAELKDYLKHHQVQVEASSRLGQYFALAAALIFTLLVLSILGN